MNREIGVREAWQMIQDKHRRLAVQEFRVFQETGRLDLGEEEEMPVAFKLTSRGPKSVIFDRGRRALLVGDKVKGDLTKNESTLFSLLLIHPLMVQTPAQLYPHFYPDDKEKKTATAYAEFFRPTISRLRKELAGIDETLPDIVQTIRGSGYVYTPHETLQWESGAST